MATSNSYNFSLTRDSIVRKAFIMIGVLNPADTLDNEDLVIGTDALNLMIRTWEANGVYLWCNQEGIVFFTVGTSSYTLGPTGDEATDISTYHRTTLSASAATSATSLTITSTTGMTVGDRIGIELDDGTLHWTTIATIPSSTSLTITSGVASAGASGNLVYTYTSKIQKPLQIVSARRRDVNDLDQAVDIYSREDYMMLPKKTDQGTVTVAYYQPLTSTGVLKLYQTPDTVREVLHITYIRPIQDFDNAADDPDFPTQWLETIIINLALRLCIYYQKSGKLQELAPLAQTLYDDLSAWSFDKVNTIIQPKTEY